jgi:hypothetical protein
MNKVFTRFLPTPARMPEECERHYTTVHVPMAQNLLRDMPGMLSYHIGRATAQADIAGGFAQKPRAWRFVILRFLPEHTLAFTPEQAEMVFQDHVNCLYRLQSSDVEETVVFERVDGQLSSAKFLFELERGATVAPDVAEAAFHELADDVAAIMERAFGARRMLVSRALNELITEPLDVEGQRAVGVRDDTTRLGWIECYFDHARWGREALAPLALEGRLRHEAFGEANLLEVDEQTALDLR